MFGLSDEWPVFVTYHFVLHWPIADDAVFTIRVLRMFINACDIIVEYDDSNARWFLCLAQHNGLKMTSATPPLTDKTAFGKLSNFSPSVSMDCSFH